MSVSSPASSSLHPFFDFFFLEGHADLSFSELHSTPNCTKSFFKIIFLLIFIKNIELLEFHYCKIEY